MLKVNDHSTKHTGPISSTSSRYERDELVKSVSSAYSTSSGMLASAGERGGRRDSRSRSAVSR